MYIELNIYIVLVFPEKSVFKPWKNIQCTTCIDKQGAPMLVGPRATAPRAHASNVVRCKTYSVLLSVLE